MTRLLERSGGQPPPSRLPPTIRRLDGRWFGDARVVFEGVQVDFIYAGINDHHGRGSYPRHAHPFSELFYTVEGEGTITYGSHTERCRPGHVYLARPGESHASTWQTAARRPWRGIIIEFNMALDPQRMAVDHDLGLARALAPAGARFLASRESTLQLPRRDADTLRHSAGRLLQMMRRHPDGGSAFVVSFWLELMALVADALHRSGWQADRGLVLPHSQKEQHLLRARQLLSAADAAAFDIAAVARRVGMSKYHFVREFRRLFGVPPARYRTGLALERAGKVLLQTDHTVSEVADRAGYTDSSAFIKAFRRQTGMTPLAYRARHRRA